MKRIAMLNLNYLMIRPYLKQYLLLIAFALVFGIAFQNTTYPGMMAIVMLINLGVYPFMLEEKAQGDILYATLSVRRRDVVVGRYLFGLLLLIPGFLLVFSPLALSLLTGGPAEVAEVAGMALAMVVVALLFNAIQFPAFFKMGYAKARYIVFVPMIFFAALFIVIWKIVPNDMLAPFIAWLDALPTQSLLFLGAALVAVVFLLYVISGVIACRFYSARDL